MWQKGSTLVYSADVEIGCVHLLFIHRRVVTWRCFFWNVCYENTWLGSSPRERIKDRTDEGWAKPFLPPPPGEYINSRRKEKSGKRGYIIFAARAFQRARLSSWHAPLHVFSRAFKLSFFTHVYTHVSLSLSVWTRAWTQSSRRSIWHWNSFRKTLSR